MTEQSADTAEAESPLVYLVAGEASGDRLGASVMAGLKARTGGRVRFAGLGGEAMAAEGLESLFPVSELAVMGVFEILPHAPRLLRRIGQVVRNVEARRPAIVITFDSWAFTMRVQARLRNRRKAGRIASALMHCVAPSVWAWRPGRAAEIAGIVDHLMVLFPFEPPYFETHGLPTTFIGHPAADQPGGDGAAFRERFSIPADARVLLVLPGSRPGEVKRLLPVFGEVAERMAKRYPGLHVVVPTVPTVAAQVRAAVEGWRMPAVVIEDPALKFDAFAAATVALAASGTVTLELGLAGVATVVGYKVNPLSAFVAKFLVDPESVILVNRILGRRVQPFFIQEKCTADRLAIAVSNLFDDPRARQEQVRTAGVVAGMLRAGTESAATMAADAVLRLVAPTGAEASSADPAGAGHVAVPSGPAAADGV